MEIPRPMLDTGGSALRITHATFMAALLSLKAEYPNRGWGELSFDELVYQATIDECQRVGIPGPNDEEFSPLKLSDGI